MRPSVKPAKDVVDIVDKSTQKRFFTLFIGAALSIVGGLLLIFFITVPRDMVSILILSCAEIVLLIAFLLTWKEKMLWVGWLLIGGIGTILFVAAILRDGILNPTYGGMLLILMSTAFLINQRATMWVAGVIGLGTLLLGGMQLAGWLPLLQRTNIPLISTLLLHLLFILLATLMLWQIFGRLTTSLLEANEKAQALSESETRIRALVEGYFEGIVITVNGKIVDLNQATADLLGYDELDHLLGINTQAFLAEDSARVVKHAIQHGIETPYEVRARRRDGTEFPALLLGRNGMFKGKKARIVGIRDLTERYQAEEQLRQAQKLESLGVMAGAIAHDFNNLLLAIIGQNAVAQAKLPVQSKAQKHIEKSMAAAKRAADLTKQLLAYSGKGHFMMHAINLNELIQENVALFDLVSTYNVVLNLSLGDNLPAIVGDEIQIQQILLNLLLNAAEAGDNEVITIQLETAVFTLAEPSVEYGRLTNQLLASGLYVCLVVSDNGPGIPAKRLTQIFEPFYSSKGTGRGLGLAAILGIMRGHRGGLTVTSTVGDGTTFSLLFPTSKQEASELTSSTSI